MFCTELCTELCALCTWRSAPSISHLLTDYVSAVSIATGLLSSKKKGFLTQSIQDIEYVKSSMRYSMLVPLKSVLYTIPKGRESIG